jgi:hypothetical protein
MDRLCGLVVRVSGYRSRGPGFYSRYGGQAGETREPSNKFMLSPPPPPGNKVSLASPMTFYFYLVFCCAFYFSYSLQNVQFIAGPGP